MSGGEVNSNAQNPWFLENTKTLRYCIRIDEDHFGISGRQADAIIQRAIHYWKLEFDLAFPGEFKLATQVFVRSECSEDLQDENIDLHFQLGTLTAKQETFLAEPTKYVGAAVRTDYDEVNLRAKGFVYISPQTGRLALKQPGIVSLRWEIYNSKLLYYTLVHELGHVFGIPHRGRSWTNIMSVESPELSLLPSLAKFAGTTAFESHFFAFKELQMLNFGSPKQLTKDFLGLSPVTSYLRLHFVDQKFEVFESENPQGKVGVRRVGTGKVADEILARRVERIVAVRLSSKQNVFKVGPRYSSYLEGPGILFVTKSGVYRTIDDGVVRNFIVELGPNSARIGTFFNGLPIVDVLHPDGPPTEAADPEVVLRNLPLRTPLAKNSQ